MWQKLKIWQTWPLFWESCTMCSMRVSGEISSQAETAASIAPAMNTKNVVRTKVIFKQVPIVKILFMKFVTHLYFSSSVFLFSIHNHFDLMYDCYSMLLKFRCLISVSKVFRSRFEINISRVRNRSDFKNFN